MTEHTEEKLLEYLSTIAAALEDVRRDIHELVDERPKHECTAKCQISECDYYNRR